MPNQLAIPLKETIPLPIGQVVREYMLANGDTHPDAFKWDIGRWEQLRSEATAMDVHADRAKSMLLYHAQLVFILTKLPPDIGLFVQWTDAFSSSSALPSTMNSLQFERANVLCNLAALYSQLGNAEDRGSGEGLRRASGYYLQAAATFAYITSDVIPKLRQSMRSGEELPSDISEASLQSLHYFMLAQAQECSWQRATIDQYKNGLIARLAMTVSEYYASSLSAIPESSTPFSSVFPSAWIAHVETKKYHFEAAAHYRKGLEDLERSRYGEQIARLGAAQAAAKAGYDIARRGGVAKATVNDVKTLLDVATKDKQAADRDNDLIYLEQIPAQSSLAPLSKADMAQWTTPPALVEPQRAIGDGQVIFGELLAWGAKRAIDVYNHRRQEWLEGELESRARQLDDQAQRTLTGLNLPAALDALQRPIGLPTSLLRKAEEVRSEDGPARVDALLDNIHALASRNREILDQAMDILDQECSEDEDFRGSGSAPADWPASSEVNSALSGKERRYQAVLEQARESDEKTQTLWDQWQDVVQRLTWDPADLEASLPSSGAASPVKQSGTTQRYARELTRLLENLDDVKRARAAIVNRGRRLADADDIRPRIQKNAAGIERWAEVRPEMFEDVMEEEMQKFAKFSEELEKGEQEQMTLLDDVKEANAAFLESRREDGVAKDRERGLQSLELAYHKYREITRNMEEGTKFYNDLGRILSQFRQACVDYRVARQREMEHALQANGLSQAVETMRMQDRSARTTGSQISHTEVDDADMEEPQDFYEPDGDGVISSADDTSLHLPDVPTADPSRKGKSKEKGNAGAFNLPSPGSSQWDTVELPGPPPSTGASPRKKTKHAVYA